jgi:hypothetical protein
VLLRTPGIWQLCPGDETGGPAQKTCMLVHSNGCKRWKRLGLKGPVGAFSSVLRTALLWCVAQTEVLAAARAALGTADVSSSTAGEGSARSSSGRSTSASAVLEQPPPPTSSSSRPTEPQFGSSPPSSSPPAGSSGSSNVVGVGSPSSSSEGSSEPLTRRWSPLSEDQDLTRHVLQNALDKMQQSGAPIAAPKEEPPAHPGPSVGSARSPAPSSSGRGSSSAGSGGGGGGGSSSRNSRDIRSGRGGGGVALMDDGHSPAPRWAQSLLGERPTWLRTHKHALCLLLHAESYY